MKEIVLDESILNIDESPPQEAYELSLDELLHELKERGIETSKLNLIEEED